MKAKKAKKVGRKPAVLDTSMWGYYESTSDSDPYLTYESSMNDYVTEEEEEPTFNLDEINALGEGMCLLYCVFTLGCRPFLRRSFWAPYRKLLLEFDFSLA